MLAKIRILIAFAIVTAAFTGSAETGSIETGSAGILPAQTDSAQTGSAGILPAQTDSAQTGSAGFQPVSNSAPTFTQGLNEIAKSTGVAKFASVSEKGWRSFVMVAIGFLLLWLGVSKGIEPLLMIPIGFGAILSNTPSAGMVEASGFLGRIFEVGIHTEVLPILIFMGIGAMSDFGPLIANPRVAFLGAAAQLGVFGTLIGVVALSNAFGWGFDIKEACAVSIIGAADGPTSIFLSEKYAPKYMGAITVAAYSYMAMVPLIQPPVMRLLTTRAERRIRMAPVDASKVGKKEKLMFPLLILAICVLFLPPALPLLGSFCFGNFIAECGVAERLASCLKNEMMNIATILLGLGIGTQLEATKFLAPITLGILFLGLAAFVIGTAGGVLFAKLMNKLSPHNPVNPLIGSAGVSAFPMAARVSQSEGQRADPENFLIFQAMGANLAGQIGSVVAAGVILALLG